MILKDLGMEGDDNFGWNCEWNGIKELIIKSKELGKKVEIKWVGTSNIDRKIE